MNKAERDKELTRLRELRGRLADLLLTPIGTSKNGKIFKNVVPDNIIPFPGNPNPVQANNSGEEKGKTIALPRDPSSGRYSYNPDQENRRAGFTSALILAGITFVAETIFLLASYFLLK